MSVFSYTAVSDTILRFHNSKAFIKMIAGPVGSGKSSAVLTDLVFRAIRQEPSYDGVRRTRMGLFRKDYPRLKKSVMKTAESWMPAEWGTIRETVPIKAVYKFPHPKDNTTIETEWWFIALKDDLDALASTELSCAYINEATEISEVVVSRLTGRIGRYPPVKDGAECTEPGIIIDFNLPSKKHWLYNMATSDDKETKVDTGEFNPDGSIKYHVVTKEFFMQPPAAFCPNLQEVDEANAKPIYRLNPNADNLANLPAGYYANLLKDNPTRTEWAEIKRLVLMEWASIPQGKLVFENEFEHETHVSREPIKPTAGMPIIIGIDTSGLHPCAVFCQQIGPTLYVLNELFGDNVSFNTFVSDMLLPTITNLYPGYEVLAVCDPANARGADTGITPIQQLIANGINATPATTNDFDLRKESVSKLLKKLHGLLISPSCEAVIDGFESSYVYTELKVKSDTPIYSDRPDKRLDASHYMDALQYACLHVTRTGAVNRKLSPEILDRLRPKPLV